MENQQVVSYNKNNALSHFKVMNKLGATFFILFIVGAFLPLADLGGWSDETLSLYNLANPFVLLIIAALGVLVNLTGLSRTASRMVSLVFVALVVGWCLVELYELYDLARTARELRGRDFEFKHFTRSIKSIVQHLPISSADDLVSLASILLTVAFVGISGCIFSPRYKENKQLKAAITGQLIDENQAEATNGKAKLENNKKSSFLNPAKAFAVLVIFKAIKAIKDIYQFIKPLINALLDKAADIICKQQPTLKREQVKIVVFVVSIVLLYLLIF
jgi:hypothetical protein